MTSRCSRRRRYTTCKKKRSCKWVKRGKSHKGYCKKRSKRRQRGGIGKYFPRTTPRSPVAPHSPVSVGSSGSTYPPNQGGNCKYYGRNAAAC